MIIHKLIAHHLKHRDDAVFYRLQAWTQFAGSRKRYRAERTDERSIWELSWHFFSRAAQRGCEVVSRMNPFPPFDLASAPFFRINLDQDDIINSDLRSGRVLNVLDIWPGLRNYLLLSNLLHPAGAVYLS